jgi:hypothetical protein
MLVGHICSIAEKDSSDGHTIVKEILPKIRSFPALSVLAVQKPIRLSRLMWRNRLAGLARMHF